MPPAETVKLPYPAWMKAAERRARTMWRAMTWALAQRSTEA
jgi:hypothetical protein